MDIDQYRKAFADELAKLPSTDKPGPASLAAIASPEAGSAVDPVVAAITILGDVTRPAAARLAAVSTVQAATFLGPSFDRYRAAFRGALRVAATDVDQALRASVLELLAIDKDEVARDLLVKGLEDDKQALVSPAKAIQLLSYDDHGTAVPMAYKIVSEDYSVDAKEEALRVLASDPKSADVLAGVLSDPAQPTRLRSASAFGLRVVDPEKFELEARKIVVNEAEDDGVRASCLGGLSHMRGYSAVADSNFTDQLAKLETTGKSGALRDAASRFLRARKPQ